MSERLILFSAHQERESDLTASHVPEELSENYTRLLRIKESLQATGSLSLTDEEYKELEKATESLAEHKRMGMFHPNTASSIRSTFRDAQNLLCQIAPPLGEALTHFEPDRTLQEILDLADEDPFYFAGLSCTKVRNRILDDFDIASQYPLDDTAYLQMQTYLKIGKFNPIEHIECLERAAPLVVTWLCEHPISRHYIEQAKHEKSETNNLKLLQAAIAANFKILEITGDIEIILQNSEIRKTSRATYFYEEATKRHIFFFKDIENFSVEEIVGVASHECIHAWQAHMENSSGYRLPNFASSTSLSEEARSSPTIKDAPVSRQQKSFSELKIKINGKNKNILNTNSAKAIAVFGRKNGIELYRKEAHEREAFGYQAHVTAEWHKLQNNEQEADQNFTTAKQIFTKDRSQKSFVPATARITKLMDKFDFMLPARNNPNAASSSSTLTQ